MVEVAPEQQRFTVTEVAMKTASCSETVRRWVREGRIQAVKIGGRVYIPATELAKLERPVVPYSPQAAAAPNSAA